MGKRSQRLHPPLRLSFVALCVALVSGSSGTEVATTHPTGPPDLPELDRAVEQLQRLEYHVSITDGGVQAPNRAQDLRTWFRPDGIEMGPRRPGSGAWRFAWRGVRWGRQKHLRTLPDVEPSFDGPRVQYARPGITEWYENRADGLEQGFVLHTRPDGDGRVRIDGRIDDSMRAALDSDHQTVDFFDAATGAHVLRYSKLKVWDARGTDLPASLSLQDDRLAILVDDTGASYPITVDPVFGTPDWTTVDPQTQSQFGGSVSTAGDVNGDGFSDVLVGAWLYDGGEGDEGRAFLYLGSAAGLAATPAWTFETNQDDAFGGHIATTAGDVNGDGFDDVIVTAFAHDSGQFDEGRAYVFHGSAAGLNAAPNWVEDGTQPGEWFGYAAATAGDVNGDGYADVVIGAPFYDGGHLNEGRALLYLGSEDGLEASPAWVTEVNQETARYGIGVGTAGDVNGDGYADVLVGSCCFDNGHIDEGAAFLYYGSGSGLSLNPNWTAEGNQADAHFGQSLATAGDIDGDGYADVVIGVPDYDGGQEDEGRVVVYRGSALGLGAVPSFTAESNQEDARLGRSVSTAGDVDGDGLADVVAGAPEFDVLQTNDGIAFVYKGLPSGSMLQIWSGFSNELNAVFGGAVGTAGDVDGDGFSEILVGAANAARASLYRGFGGSLSVAVTQFEGNNTGAEFGVSVASAGDVNGDGYSDVIVGAHWYDTGFSKQGRAFVYHGSPVGTEAQPAWTADGGGERWWFGHSVAGAGDVNGDGYADVVVGAPYYENGDINEGAVFVYHGSAAGLGAAPAWQREGGPGTGRLGFSVASAGDVNGDGFSDVILGSPAYVHGQSLEGAVWVHHGSAAGLGPVAWSVEGDQQNLWLGWSVNTAGDVNGDGFSDVVVGSPGYGQIAAGAGAARVFHGSATGLEVAPNAFLDFDQGGAQFGYSVGTAGDVNGDGFSDVIVGAVHAVNGHANEGMAFVFHGSASGLDPVAAWDGDGDQVDAHYGYCVGTAGDVNGDGFSDVIVGALFFEVYGYNEDEGKAFVYLGSPTGLSSVHDGASRLEGGAPGAQLGISVGTAGDVNGDGFSDVIVGAFRYDGGHVDEGRALVHLGNKGDGREYRPRQVRSTGTVPIVPLGVSDAPDAFGVEGRGSSAAGRGRVRLVVEAKPLGVPFDGTGLHVSSFTDSGDPQLPSPVMAQVIGGLAPDTPYHWRLRVESGSPFFPRSPWMSPSHNGPQETDLRTAASVVAVADPVVVPTEVHLAAPRPSPFEATTEIAFHLARPGQVRLNVYDLRGRRVVNLVDGPRPAGSQVVRWDGRGEGGARVAAGTYFLRLDSDGGPQTRKVVVVR